MNYKRACMCTCMCAWIDGQQCVRVWIRRAQLRWIGHLVRREGPYPPKLMLFAHSIRHDLPINRHPGRPPMSYLEQMQSILSKLSGPSGALTRVISTARQFGVLFKDMDGNYMSDRHRIDWMHVALNRVLWSRVVSLGAMDC